jgi:hypothetical protein
VRHVTVLPGVLQSNIENYLNYTKHSKSDNIRRYKSYVLQLIMQLSIPLTLMQLPSLPLVLWGRVSTQICHPKDAIKFAMTSSTFMKEWTQSWRDARTWNIAGVDSHSLDELIWVVNIGAKYILYPPDSCVSSFDYSIPQRMIVPCKVSFGALDKMVMTGNMAVVDRMIKDGQVLSKGRAMASIMRSDNPHMLRWILNDRDLRCLLCDEYATYLCETDDVSKNVCNMRAMKWLHEFVSSIFTRECIDECLYLARCRHFDDMSEWLISTFYRGDIAIPEPPSSDDDEFAD